MQQPRSQAGCFQPRPSLSYIAGPAKGRNAPAMLRRSTFAASAEAPAFGSEYLNEIDHLRHLQERTEGQQSNKYRFRYRLEVEFTKMNTMPAPTGTVPRIGTIQCVCLSTLQPYQNKPAGRGGGHVRHELEAVLGPAATATLGSTRLEHCFAERRSALPRHRTCRCRGRDRPGPKCPATSHTAL